MNKKSDWKIKAVKHKEMDFAEKLLFALKFSKRA